MAVGKRTSWADSGSLASLHDPNLELAGSLCSPRRNPHKSLALSVGEGLEAALRPGDALVFSRDGNGDHSYSLKRSQEPFSPHSFGRSDLIPRY